MLVPAKKIFTKQPELRFEQTEYNSIKSIAIQIKQNAYRGKMENR